MSVIRKLLIQGIRSFDPQNQDIIEFYTPLTIIVGQNGCGKTTIIESLKYITTGDLPPNSKGGAFIHDPKLVGENEVKAQVKLRFYNVSQRSMTCVRSMLLTQKKVTVSQKTLEGVLSFDATATESKVSISSRCADLDAMMPEQLGVSKAVLDNVIFCHQEESNWPLSEPSILKKKFDEIFAATRYTKALESIKNIRKGQAVEIRVQRTELKHLEEKKAKAEKVKEEYEKSTASIHQYKTRIDGILEQEKAITTQIDTLNIQLQEFMSLSTVVEGLQMSLDQKVASYQEMAANTRIMDIPDQELEAKKTEIAQRIETQDSGVQDKRNCQTKLQSELAGIKSEIEKIQYEIGRLNAVKGELEKKIADRVTVISEICQAVNISLGSPSSFGSEEQHASACHSKLQSMLQNANDERKVINQRATSRDNELQAEVNATQSKIHDFVNAATVCERQMAAYAQEIQSLQAKQVSIKTNTSQIESTKNDLAAAKQQLEQVRSQNAENVYNEQAKQKRLELSGIAEEIARLNAEISRNNMQADTRAKLGLAQTELEDKENRWKQLTNEVGGSGGDMSKYKAEVIVSNIETKKQRVAELNAESKTCTSELASSRMRLAMAQRSMEDQEQEMGIKRKRISDLCDGESFDSTYSDAQADLHELVELAGHYKSATSMYKAYINKIETEHACPTCQRGWSNKEDEAKVMKQLQLDYTSAPAELLRVEGEIGVLERRVNELSGMKSIVNDVKQWDERNRQDLERQITDLKSKTDEFENKADDIDTELAVLGTELDESTALLGKSEELEKLDQARKQLQGQIKTYEQELLVTGSTKTADMLQSEISTLQTQEAACRRELDRLGQECILKEREITIRQDAVRELEKVLSGYARQQEEYQSITDRIKAIETSIEASKAECETNRNMANELQPQLGQRKQALDIFRQETKAQEETFEQRIRELTQCTDRLDMMNRDINNTSAQLQCSPADCAKYSDKLSMTHGQKEEMQKSESEMQHKLDEVTAELQESSRIAAELVTQQREITDNIRLRANKADQGRLQGELQDALDKQTRLESQLSEIYSEDINGNGNDSDMTDNDSDTDVSDDDNGVVEVMTNGKRSRKDGISGQRTAKKRASSGGARLQQRREVLNDQLSKLTSERAGLQGEVKQIEDQANRYMRELSSDYKDIEKLYVKQLVQCKTGELANTDLETYGKALDAAIMRYHSIKMEDINKIIRELWINTYQGNDIDTIEIRSEIDGARNSRSHNYRVVMIKGGHAIDMRGRCSAGQKVLACLIIRLALAETFSVNCGILALDEPTTNLDQENIDSLAQSLARIIKSRQEQRNFQLIVITHDEKFMQLLGKSEYADYYWRVYKDENQRSVFTRKDIANS